MLFERSFETEKISVMKGSRGVLVKVVLFQLRGRSHPYDDATPTYRSITHTSFESPEQR